MAYRVLSLKWRPQTFKEVVGQKHITQSLENALKLDRVSHAYTFCGPRGVGKTTTARILSKELNGVDSIENNFDIFEMDAASNRGIDEIRSLRENVKILPAHGKYKIYIIDEVHMLTKEAFNALLKTLEEPPSHVIFILATTDPYKLPPTILSRTQRYDFKRLNINDIVVQLKKILNKDKIKYDLQSLELIAYKADGSMRDALSYLDQVINFCNDHLALEQVQLSLGMINDKFYFDLLKNIYGKKSSEVILMITESIKMGVSINDFISDFNRFLRSILYSILNNNINADSNISKWLETNKELVSELSLIRIMDSLLKLESQLRYITNPDIALEILMIKISNYDSIIDISSLLNRYNDTSKMKKTTSIKSVHNRMDLKEEGKNKKNVPKKIKEIENKSDSIQDKNKISQKQQVVNDKIENSINSTIINKKINNILQIIEKDNAKTAHFLDGFEVISFTDNIATLKVKNLNQFVYSALNKDKLVIENAINVIFEINCKVKIEQNINSEKNKNKVKKKDLVVDEEHPLLMDALDKFKGEVIK